MKKLLSILSALLPLLVLELFAADRAAATDGDLRLPPWMAGHENLMPKISPEQIQEIVGLQERLSQSDDRKPLSEQPEMVKTLRDLVAKGDLLEKAMVWLYVTAEPVERTPPDLFYFPAESKRIRILERFLDDPLSRTYLVPILRPRVDWIAGEVEANRFPNMFASGEVDLIRSNLGLWGDESEDRPRLNRMRKAFETSTAPETRSYKYSYSQEVKDVPPLPDDSPLSDAGRRRASKSMSEHYKDLLPDYRTPASNPPRKPVAEEAVSKKNNPAPVAESQSWTLWLFTAIAVTIGAAWLLIRKKK